MANKRNPRRPKMRWIDDIQVVAGVQWMTTTSMRKEWQKIGDAVIQKWKRIAKDDEEEDDDDDALSSAR